MTTTRTMPRTTSRLSSFFFTLLTTSRLLVLQPVDATPNQYGLQMGPTEGQGMFASSFVLDPLSEQVVITGSTYDRGESYRCFLLTMDPASGQFRTPTTYGHEIASESEPMSTSQACSHLWVHQNERLFLTGHSGTDQTGLLESLYRRDALFVNRRYGFVMDLLLHDFGIDSSSTSGPLELLGGHVLQEATAVYPVATASHPQGDVVYVASMKTDQGTANGHNLPAMDPNLVLPIGTTYGLVLESYTVQSVKGTPRSKPALQQTLDQKHRIIYEPANGGSVYVAGMIQINDDTLIVAGHTFGQGEAFGRSFTTDNMQASSSSLDGFVTKFNADSLTPYIPEQDGIFSSFRVESMDDGADYVYGICGHGYSTENEHTDGNHIYVVGATTGTLTTDQTRGPALQDAYIMKIAVDTTQVMEVVWTRQLSIHPDDADKTQARLFGIACAVRDDQHVWWAGHVTNGARVHGVQHAYGEQDMFVEKIVAENGQVEFTRQFGSPQDDELAWRGGLQLDRAGNAIVVGNTLGSFFRDKAQGDESDVFVLSIAANGDLVAPWDPAAPPVASMPPVEVPVQAPVQVPVEAPVHTPVRPLRPDQQVEPESTHGHGSLVLVLVLLLVGIGVALWYYQHQQSSTEAITDRSKVTPYLLAFDEENVELKHSATGGWHCSYVNDLARGKCRSRYSDDGAQDDPLARRPSDSRTDNGEIARQSLFLDDRRMSYGGKKLQTVEDDERGYGGLVDAYHSDEWDKKEETGTWGRGRGVV